MVNVLVGGNGIAVGIDGSGILFLCPDSISRADLVRISFSSILALESKALPFCVTLEIV